MTLYNIMDVHRARFVPYPASAINSLAFSHPSRSRKSKNVDKYVRLAVGRENGDIEIWNPLKGDWVQETVFPGAKDRSVEGLAWIQDTEDVNANGTNTPGHLRLFSIGYSNSVTEWDLTAGLSLRHSSGNTSEIWSLAAQPRWTENPDEGSEAEAHEQSLVIGCADGTLVVLSTANNDLQFKRFLSRPTERKARCLSLTFKDRNTVVAGYANSRVKVFDIRDGSTIREIAMGSGPAGGPKDILVWAVACLPNGDIVTGDSSSDVRIFDGKFYSQLQRLSGGHEADVLAVAVSHDGKSMFSTGPDRRVVAYQLQQRPEAPERNSWSQISYQRYHSHDVKALAAFEGKKISVLVSGGIDTQLNVVPIQQFGEENNRAISGLPQYPPVACSREGRLLVSWWGRDLWIWQVEGGAHGQETHRLLTKMNIKGDESIASASLSRDGSLLAVTTMAEVKIFQLRLRGMRPSQTLRITKLETPKPLFSQGARLVHISPDGKWLALVRQSSKMDVCRIIQDFQGQTRVIPKLASLTRLPPGKEKARKSIFTSLRGSYLRTVTRIVFSSDSRFLAASDLSGRIESWMLLGHEDLTEPEVEIAKSDVEASSDEDEEEQKISFHGQSWAQNPLARLTPKVESAPVILTFRPQQQLKKSDEVISGEPNHAPRHKSIAKPSKQHYREHLLVVVTAKQQLYEFDLLSGRMTDWSNKNTPHLPAEFKALKDRAMGSVWHVNAQWQRLWLYGSNWTFMLDLSQDFEDDVDSAVQHSAAEPIKQTKKRKREHDNQWVESLRGLSGAGSKKADLDVANLSRRAQKLVQDGEKHEWKSLEVQPLSSDDDEMDIDVEGEPLLTAPRRSDEPPVTESTQGREATKKGKFPKTWHTFKYRPILGLVPLSEEIDDGDEDGASTDDKVLEVVLVERPVWDLGLPEPLRGVYERD